MHVEKTVFISYRRTNVFNALAIYQNLTANGFDVFFDYESIKSGSFEQIILNQIAARAHFVVLLTPSALERCNEPGDWLRREIEHALDTKRNIVPLMFEGFSFNDVNQYLTGKLAALSAYNAMRVPVDYFGAAMDRLRNDFLNTPLDVVIHPPPFGDFPTVQEIQAVATNQPTPTEYELSAEELYELGNKKFIEEDYDVAITYYNEATRIYAQYASAFYSRALAHERQGDLANALSDYDEALRLNPSDSKSLGNRGWIRWKQGDVEGAMKDYDKAIHVHPTNPFPYNNRGILFRQLGNLTNAIEDYTRAIDLKHPEIWPMYNRGIAYFEIGQYDRAIADFTEALKHNPKDPEQFYYWRGSSYEKIGDLIRASHDYVAHIELGGEFSKTAKTRIEEIAKRLQQ